MECPRCDGPLAVFSLRSNDRSATVCESCGYADVSASHGVERVVSESWARALARFDETGALLEAAHTDRTERVALPFEDAPPPTGPSAETLESAVSVAPVLSGEGDVVTEEGAEPTDDPDG